MHRALPQRHSLRAIFICSAIFLVAALFVDGIQVAAAGVPVEKKCGENLKGVVDAAGKCVLRQETQAEKDAAANAGDVSSPTNSAQNSSTQVESLAPAPVVPSGMPPLPLQTSQFILDAFGGKTPATSPELSPQASPFAPTPSQNSAFINPTPTDNSLLNLSQGIQEASLSPLAPEKEPTFITAPDSQKLQTESTLTSNDTAPSQSSFWSKAAEWVAEKLGLTDPFAVAPTPATPCAQEPCSTAASLLQEPNQLAPETTGSSDTMKTPISGQEYTDKLNACVNNIDCMNKVAAEYTATTDTDPRWKPLDPNAAASPAQALSAEEFKSENNRRIDQINATKDPTEKNTLIDAYAEWLRLNQSLQKGDVSIVSAVPLAAAPTSPLPSPQIVPEINVPAAPQTPPAQNASIPASVPLDSTVGKSESEAESANNGTVRSAFETARVREQLYDALDATRADLTKAQLSTTPADSAPIFQKYLEISNSLDRYNQENPPTKAEVEDAYARASPYANRISGVLFNQENSAPSPTQEAQIIEPQNNPAPQNPNQLPQVPSGPVSPNQPDYTPPGQKFIEGFCSTYACNSSYAPYFDATKNAADSASQFFTDMLNRPTPSFEVPPSDVSTRINEGFDQFNSPASPADAQNKNTNWGFNLTDADRAAATTPPDESKIPVQDRSWEYWKWYTGTMIPFYAKDWTNSVFGLFGLRK